MSSSNWLVSVILALTLAMGEPFSIAEAQSISKDGPVLFAKAGGGGGGGGGAGGAGGGAGGSGGSGGGSGSGGTGSAGGAGSSGSASGSGAAGGAGSSGASGSGGGGDGAVSGVGASPTPAWDVFVANAQEDLARGDFDRALAGAEMIAGSKAPAEQQAAAMLIAGDAAFALRNYARASAYYTPFLSSYRSHPDAPRATMARGWAKFRAGDAGHAHWTWSYLVDQFPRDARAPLALILAAGAANKAGDLASAQAALDRLLANYPRSPYVRAALLQRALLGLQRGDENLAVRELGEVIRTSGTPLVQDYAAIAAAFATPGAEAALESASPRSSVPGDSLERFATAVIDTCELQATPPLLHGIALVAASERGWTDPLVDSLANRLVDDFPSYQAAPALLTRVAGAAASAGRWPVATRDYEKLVARYRDGSVGQRARTGEMTSEAAYTLGRLAGERRQHATALEWFANAVAAAPESRWGRLALLGTGDSLAALNRNPEAVAAYTKLLDSVPADAWRRNSAYADERAAAGEAAYRGGKLLRSEGRHGEALNMFIISSFFTTGSPAYGRALIGAMQCFVAIGDRAGAEAYYRQVQASGADESVLAEARRVLDTTAAASALPAVAR